MKNLREWCFPKTIEEAASFLSLYGGRAQPIAGGTGLVGSRDPTIQSLVDISRLGLDYISVEEELLRFGATVSAEAIRLSPKLATPALEGMREAAMAVGATPVRNGVTLGGNVLQVRPWSVMPLMLLVLDGKLKVHGRDSLLGLAEHYDGDGDAPLEPGELVVEVVVPRPAAGSGSAFQRLVTTATDYPQISCAASITLGGDGAVSAASVAVGAVLSKPELQKDTAEGLKGKQPTSGAFAAAAAAVAGSLNIRSDFRTSKEYRQEVLPVIIRRTLESAAERARTAGGQS